MPLNGLPSALEDLLDFLASRNSIKSWNYYQNHKSSGTTLTIKWTSDFGDTGSRQSDSISYSRKSPEQLSRENKRENNWKMSRTEKTDLNSHSHFEDIQDTKSEVLTAVKSSDRHDNRAISSYDDALPLVSAECLSSGKPVSRTSEPGDHNSLSIPKLGYDCVDPNLKGSEKPYPKFTDNCTKCNDVKIHTDSSSHSTVMKQMNNGPPFKRRCGDCNALVLDSSLPDWKYRLNETVRLCNFCSGPNYFFQHFVCESCIPEHAGHSIREGVIRFHVEKNKKSGKYDFGPVLMDLG